MKKRALTQIIIMLFWAFIGSPTPASAQQSPVLQEENELIMMIALADGTPVADSMTVYRIGDVWFLPLTHIIESLGVPISTSPALGKAEGYFLEESRVFSLDKSQCQAQSGSAVLKFDCGSVVIHNDEIFVDSKELEKWFPVHFKFDSYASEISVESSLKFPKQSRLEREKLASALGNSQSTNNRPDDFEFLLVPDEALAGPLIDQQLTLTKDPRDGSGFRHDTSIAGELLGFETKSFIGGSDKMLDQWSLNFSKKDPQSHLLGDLQAKEVQAFDVYFPSVSLLGSSFRARGLLISNFPLSQPSNFSSHDFQGPLPSGWEVELYQNDLLVGRQTSSASTEYKFKDVLLTYGTNRFRLVFYGPQGQRREEVETIQIGQNQVRPSEKNYRFALGEKDDSPGDLRTLLQYQQGLNKDWSVATSYLGTHMEVENESTHYGLLGFFGSFSRFFLSFSLAANNRSGNALEQSIQTPFDRGSVGLTFTELSNFKSDLFNQSKISDLNRVVKLNGNWSAPSFLGLHFGGEVAENEFVDHKSTTATQRTTLKTGPFLWFNTLNYDPDVAPALNGQLSSVSNLSGYEVRPTLDYSTKSDAFGIAIQKRLTDKTTMEIGVRDSYKESKNEYMATINHLFNQCTVSADGSADSKGDYKITGLLSYSLALDPRSNSLDLSPQPQTDYGAVSVFVYLDMNQDGIFNEGDRPMTGIQVLVNQNDSGFVTDSNGTVLVTKMPVHEFVDISISSKSLVDPLYKPAKRGVRIIPRPGHVFQLSLPVIIQSEIDGLVQIESQTKIRGRGQIEVLLKDSEGKSIASKKTDSDGFFLIENVSMGKYELSLNPDQLKRLGLRSHPSSVQIEVPATGLMNSSFDFSLEKDQESSNP